MRRKGNCAVRAIVAVCAAAVIGHAPAAGAAAHPDDDPAADRAAIVSRLARGEFGASIPLIESYLADHPDDPVMRYNLACALAQAGERDAAAKAVLDAVKAGFHDFSVMRRDPDLRPIRDHPRFRAVLAARDAADDLLGERRVNAWMTRNVIADPTHSFDEARRIDLFSSLPQAEHDALAGQIGRLAEHLRASLFHGALTHRFIVAVVDDATARDVFDHANVRGRYRHAARELVAARAGVALTHELVHAIHHLHMDAIGQQHPIWIQEGLASLYEAYEINDESGEVRILPNERDQFVRRLAREDELPAWRDLMTMSQSEFTSNAAAHYAAARSIFAFIEERGELGSWYQTYIRMFEEDPTGAGALATVFDSPLESIDAEWRAWARDREIDGVHVAASRAPTSPTPPRMMEGVGEESAGRGKARAPRVETAYEAVRPRLLDEYPRSIPALRAIVERDPEFADARYDLGLALIAAGDFEAAARQRDALRQMDRNLANLLDALLAD